MKNAIINETLFTAMKIKSYEVIKEYSLKSLAELLPICINNLLSNKIYTIQIE